MNIVRAKTIFLFLSLAAFVILLSPYAPANDAHAGSAFVMPTPYMVKDINANNESSSPGCIIALADFMLCKAVDGVHGRELWRSDGTPEGSYLLKDINPGEDGSDAYGFVAANDGMTIFFSADDGEHGNELWKTDGTPDGTVIVRDILAGSSSSYPDDLTAVDDKLYFSVFADQEEDRELWITDGTKKGTKQVLEINPDGSDQVRSLEVMGGILYFTANDGQHGVELWRSDGTEAGTYMVKDTNPFDDNYDRIYWLTAVGNKLFFVLWLDESDGGIASDLWVSDGTSAGTALVKEINEGPGGSRPENLTVYNGLLFFYAFDGSQYGLWQSDGTAKNTRLVKLVQIGIDGDMTMTIANDLLFFPDRSNNLWRSDGTTDGTFGIKKMPTDIGEDYWSQECREEFFAGGNRVYACRGDEHGYELWTSDGTNRGTYLVKDIYEGPESSSPRSTLIFNGKAYFTAYRRPEGRELWVTDGTETGTMLVADLNTTGNSDSSPGTIGPLVNNGSQLFFRARDTIAGNEPMLTDGTEAGTYLLKDIAKGSYYSGPGYHWPDPVVLANGQIFFVASTDNWGQEMWTSDGTGKGTAMLLDICSGSMDANIGHLAATENAAFFTSDVPTNRGCSSAQRLWKSQGPAGGAVPIADSSEIVSLAASSKVAFYVIRADDVYELWAVDESNSTPLFIADHVGSNLAVVNDSLFFYSSDRLWKTDGTAAGTIRINESNYISEMFPLDDSLYYLQLTESGSWEIFDLWVSNGTRAGTRLVRGGWPYNTAPTDFAHAGNVVYFTAATKGDIRALWRTDGTPEGTEKIRSFIPECEYGPGDLAAVGDMLFFRGCDEAHGYELWTSDGTKAGTKMAYEINPLNYDDGYANPLNDSYPNNMAAFGNKLYFAANDGQHGMELWALDLALVADFEASPLQGVPPLEVAFNNLSTGDFDTCIWDFGDGKTKTMCGDPVHRYRQEGQYTVSLTVSGAGDENRMTKEEYIAVEKQHAFLPSVIRP